MIKEIKEVELFRAQLRLAFGSQHSAKPYFLN
jgi:hypothetical protein